MPPKKSKEKQECLLVQLITVKDKNRQLVKKYQNHVVFVPLDDIFCFLRTQRTSGDLIELKYKTYSPHIYNATAEIIDHVPKIVSPDTVLVSTIASSFRFIIKYK